MTTGVRSIETTNDMRKSWHDLVPSRLSSLRRAVSPTSRCCRPTPTSLTTDPSIALRRHIGRPLCRGSIR
jgi:hypothetical protein